MSLAPQANLAQHRSVGVEALASLRGRLTDGRWGPGTRLPTEEDLARELSVSRGTLRHALKQLEREGVLRAGRGRGRIVVPAMQYRAGGSLVSHIVAILTEMSWQPRSGRPLQLERDVAQGAMDALDAASLHMLRLHPDALAGAGLQRFLDQRTDGVIVSSPVARSCEGQALLEQLVLQRLPVVVNDDGSALSRYDRVISDHEAGAYELTRWLLSQGRRRILPLWGVDRERYWVKMREDGYARAMREAGLGPLPPVYALVAPAMAAELATQQALAQRARQYAGFLVEHLLCALPVDAVMAHTDGEAFAIAAACRLCGKQPQRDLLIVGYDAYWPNWLERQWEPAVPVASVNKLNRDTGAEMVRLLLDRIHGRLPTEPQRIVLKPELVVTGITPGFEAGT